LNIKIRSKSIKFYGRGRRVTLQIFDSGVCSTSGA
jgi:hypothetical protein